MSVLGKWVRTRGTEPEKGETEKGSNLRLTFGGRQVIGFAMSRPLRIEYPDAWYYVMNRGRRAETIFHTQADYDGFVALLKEAVEIWNLRISAFCLMPNHYHLLVQTPEGNLSRCMRHINGIYTQRFNRSHKYAGQLFRGRYKAILVEENEYLLQLVRYIHQNPVKAKIVEKLAGYRWSSHRAYLSKTDKWSWLYKDFILAMLSQHPGRCVAEYKQFMHDDTDDELTDIFEKKKMPAFLGGQDFIAWVKDTFYSQKQDQDIADAALLAPELSMIKQVVSAYYNINPANLSHTRRGIPNEPRDMAVFLTRKLRRDTLATIGDAFGMNGYSTVSSAIERIKTHLSHDEKLTARKNEIYRRLTKSQAKT